jgi:hypothetical protein
LLVPKQQTNQGGKTNEKTIIRIIDLLPADGHIWLSQTTGYY